MAKSLGNFWVLRYLKGLSYNSVAELRDLFVQNRMYSLIYLVYFIKKSIPILIRLLKDINKQ